MFGSRRTAPGIVATVLCGMQVVGCYPFETDARERSEAIVIPVSAQDVRYHYLPLRREEGAVYYLPGEGRGRVELDEIKETLSRAGWSELQSPESGRWKQVVRRERNGSEEQLECARWEWSKRAQVVTYSFCIRARTPGRMEVGVLRLPRPREP